MEESFRVKLLKGFENRLPSRERSCDDDDDDGCWPPSSTSI